MSFEQLGLRDELLKATQKKGYTSPTPIQAKVIPAILEGRDILARAQTGTGKTDAFALPMVDILSRSQKRVRSPRALVLTPTRELALQVSDCIKVYTRSVSLRCTVVHGGVRIEPQIQRLHRGIDILIATPGRLLDLADQGAVIFSGIDFLVFDEADRMLDLGFSREINGIIGLVPVKRRTMLFSATYTPAVLNLAKKMLQNPERIEVTPRHTAAKHIIQKVHLVDKSNKRALLIHLITSGNRDRVLVFMRTKHGANKLTEKLVSKGLGAAALHSDKSQSLRTRILETFKNGEIRILVATDVAARGLDISDLPYVVNYDIPATPEDYVHRIGRTGRAGVTGIAVSLVSREEQPFLTAIEKLLKRKIKVETVPGYTEASDVPDFVLFRPDSPSSAKNADPELKEFVIQRNVMKKKTRLRKSKTSGNRPGPTSKPISGKPKTKPVKKPDKSGLRPQSVKKKNTKRQG